MNGSHDIESLKSSIQLLSDSLKDVSDALEKGLKNISEESTYETEQIEDLVRRLRQHVSELDQLNTGINASVSITAEEAKRCRDLLKRARNLLQESNDVAQAAPKAAAKAQLDKHRGTVAEAISDVFGDLDDVSQRVGAPEIVDEMQKFRNSYERLTDDRLGDIADHIASFAPPAAPAGLAPFGAPAAFAGMEAQRAEDVLSRLLGTALAPAGKAVGADFAQMLTLALDQRVASEEDGGYQVLTSVAPVVAGIRQPPRGRQASLLRDVQSQSEAFLKIMRELPSKRRNPDQTAITDHRGRLGRYVEDLISLTGFESGPLIERASFQVDAIEREWTALKRELGILLNGQVHAANVAAVGENILDSGRKARLVNRSLEEAEGEEIDSEAKRGDDYLERINNAFASWEKDRKQSRGAKTARLLQHVRSLQDNVRQLERAFDLAELTLQDRLSRRFKVGGDGDAPVQALIDWLTEDGKRWMQELSDGDTRATVLDAIIHGAEKQAILVESLDEALEQLVSVGRGRVKRALREVSGALDAITDEANRLQQP